MIYVILGIIILVVSFVVALISLIYEQRKVDELKSEEGPEISTSDSIRRIEVENEKDEKLGQDNLMSAQEVTIKNVESEAVPEDENVWWKRLEDKTDGGIAPTKDEEASIQAIREELSKMISTKNDPEEVIEAQEQNTFDRNEDKRQRVLVGEFSLRDVKRGN